MKPYPFVSLNHFTVPVAIRDIFLLKTDRLKLPSPARGLSPAARGVSYGVRRSLSITRPLRAFPPAGGRGPREALRRRRGRASPPPPRGPSCARRGCSRRAPCPA